MSETLSNTLYGVSFFVNLFVLVGMWWATAKSPETRRLWGLLALGGTLSMMADLAWGLLELMAPDLWLDWIDYLYFGRYLLVFLAFWSYPKPWYWRQWLAMLAGILWGWILIWLLLVFPAKNLDIAYALAGMIFPVLDVGILYAAIFRWQTCKQDLKSVLLWMSLAMFSYGMANWFNYNVRVRNPEADSLAALILWLLSSVCMGMAVWRFYKRPE